MTKVYSPGKFVRIGYDNDINKIERAYPAWLPETLASSGPYIYIPHGSVVLLVSSSYDFCDIIYGNQVLYVHTSHCAEMTSQEVEEWANAQPQIQSP